MTRPIHRRPSVLLLLVLLVTSVITLNTFAQTGTSSVAGTVTDAQGKVVSGATVTLTNPAKNFSRTQTTNESGAYSFNSIPPDTYVIEVTATGFKKTVVNEVQALVAKPTDANIQLEVGAVTEAVTVTSGGVESLVNTQDASLGNNFESRQITQLPLEARNINSLLTLQTATTREGYVSGSRSDQSNVTLDGVDINEAQTNQVGTARGGASADSMQAFSEQPDTGTVLRLNGEAIEEFRVTTTNPNAAMGRSSGAQITLLSKSGSNQWRGSAFIYNRDTAFTANDWFGNADGLYGSDDQAVIDGFAAAGDEVSPRPKLKRNVFGGAFGGPVVKDRFFFFYSYEGRRDQSEATGTARVPLASLGRGEIRYPNVDGGITTLTAADMLSLFPELGGINPFVPQVLAEAASKYPANTSAIGDGYNTGGYRFNAPVPVGLNLHIGRFDYNLNDHHLLTARVQIQHDNFGGTRLFPDTPSQDTWSHPWGISLGHTWTVTDSIVNNFRYGKTRAGFTRQGDAAKNEIYFRNIYFPVLDSRTLARETPVQNFTDDVSWVKGNHTFQFGTNIRTIRNRRTSYTTAFDTAYTNGTGWDASGSPIVDRIDEFSRSQKDVARYI
ncbi:MAG TPA: carboxypeptidase-like regulatory domain-containing protein, partial [Pyrinomonadaceae bacterium]|nr:carboxypeptidase-like regulatory domain-containing protein [Pyrinomonadaceae bacterium]